jgi:hypothetical protein
VTPTILRSAVAVQHCSDPTSPPQAARRAWGAPLTQQLHLMIAPSGCKQMAMSCTSMGVRALGAAAASHSRAPSMCGAAGTTIQGAAKRLASGNAQSAYSIIHQGCCPAACMAPMRFADHFKNAPCRLHVAQAQGGAHFGNGWQRHCNRYSVASRVACFCCIASACSFVQLLQNRYRCLQSSRCTCPVRAHTHR